LYPRCQLSVTSRRISLLRLETARAVLAPNWHPSAVLVRAAGLQSAPPQCSPWRPEKAHACGAPIYLQCTWPFRGGPPKLPPRGETATADEAVGPNPGLFPPACAARADRLRRPAPIHFLVRKFRSSHAGAGQPSAMAWLEDLRVARPDQLHLRPFCDKWSTYRL